MPSIDESTAFERGQQICRSASALQATGVDSEESRVIVGLAQASPDDEFQDVVSWVTELVGTEDGEDTDTVRLYGQAATA